ncbi:MAG: phosphotransferase family protein [Halobacteriaceae archaeon]
MARDTDRTLPREEIAGMVERVEPGWRLRGATPSASGWTAVYRVTVDTGSGRRECVLKATPHADHPAGVGAEARIQAVVGATTAIPVPAVFGVVDADDSLRTPFFLMEAMPGETVTMADVGSLPDAVLRGVARETGRYLGELHGLDTGLDAFGKCVGHDSPPLRGGPPSGDPAALVAEGGDGRWPAVVRGWVEEDLDALADSRFADLAPALRRELLARVDALGDSFAPVLGRVDHGWSNLLVRDGHIEGVIDWGSRFAVPPGFDLAVVEHLLAGGWWLPLPEVPDRRPLVREALLAGYREAATVPPDLAAQRACYHLDDTVRWIAHLEEKAGSDPRAVPEARVEEAAAGFRAAVEAEL